jgi:hypothetical protein
MKHPPVFEQVFHDAPNVAGKFDGVQLEEEFETKTSIPFGVPLPGTQSVPVTWQPHAEHTRVSLKPVKRVPEVPAA